MFTTAQRHVVTTDRRARCLPKKHRECGGVLYRVPKAISGFYFECTCEQIMVDYRQYRPLGRPELGRHAIRIMHAIDQGLFTNAEIGLREFDRLPHLVLLDEREWLRVYLMAAKAAHSEA